jgi:hypothetical protein
MLVHSDRVQPHLDMIAETRVVKNRARTEAARILNLNPLTVLRQIHAGIIPAEQYCKGAPWVIKRRSIEDPDLVERRKGPSSSNPDQKTLVFQ